MSAIVNERDRILQSASQRIAETQMTPGVVVQQEQVEGLELVDSKLVVLSASSQIFRIPKDVNGQPQPVSPDVISFTPTIKGLPQEPVFSVSSGNAKLSYANGGALLNYTDMLTDTATVKCSVSDVTTAYYDQITVAKVREGADALTGLLSNEAHTVSADSLGNVLSYSGAGGNFVVYQGATDVTSACTFSVVKATAGVNTTINTQGAYAVTAIAQGTDTIVVTYRATFGSSTVDKDFTVSKAKQGNPGGGTPGQRGSMTFHITISGTVWDNTAADNAVVSQVGSKVLNDVVEETNQSAQFTESRFWDGSNWDKITAFVNGNLLVDGTVGAQKVAANAITGDKLAVGAITADSAAVDSLNASKLTAGFINAQRIAADTITTNMILSKSCTAFDTFVRGAGNGTQSFSFTMDHSGVATAIGIVNYSFSGSSGNFSFSLDIDGQQTTAVDTSSGVVYSLSGMSGLPLSAGTHTVNLKGTTSLPLQSNHGFYVTILRSYR
jgi:hypothetical protein